MPTGSVKIEAEISGNGNALPNSSLSTAQGPLLHGATGSYTYNQEAVVSKQMPVCQRRTTYGRKRSLAESEDELTESAKHPRRRAYYVADIENWESVILEKISRSEPETIRGLLDAGKYAIKQQRSRIGLLEAEMKKEKKFRKQEEKLHKTRYAELKTEMTSVLMANVGQFGVKVSDDTIAGEWTQLYYNIQNIVSNYLEETSQSRTPVHEISPVRVILARRKLWEIIAFHCFEGYMGYDEIGQVLAQRIDRIDPRALPSCQYLKMISNMKSAFDPTIKENGISSGDFEMNQAFIDTVACFGKDVTRKLKETLKRDVGEVLKQAANLHFYMMRSKAIFVVKWVGNDNDKDTCEYDPDTMMTSQDVVDTTSSGYAVDMIESPAVWKFGNADGENFDSVMVLCKSVVPVKEKEATVVLG